MSELYSGTFMNPVILVFGLHSERTLKFYPVKPLLFWLLLGNLIIICPSTPMEVAHSNIKIEKAKSTNFKFLPQGMK